MRVKSHSLIICSIIAVIAVILVSSTISIWALVNNGTSRTIMIYMVGANLESENGLATADLESIRTQNKDVKVLLIAGGSKQWNNDYISNNETSIYELTDSGFNKVKAQNKTNMGDSRTLTNFLNFVHDYSKTDAYDLIFWNHGGAIDGSEYDELTYDDNLSLLEMDKGLSDSSFDNKKFETIIFRTCLNGTLEVNSIMSKYAKYLIASEETTLGANYTSVLNFINDIDKKDSSKDVGLKFIESYKKQIVDIKNNTFASNSDTIYSTYSLIDLGKVSKLRNNVNDFFQDIDVNRHYNYISKTRANLYQYASEVPGYDMIDLYNLVNSLSKLSPKKAKKVLSSFNDAVVYNYATDQGSRGISLYFPYNGKAEEINKFFGIYDNLSNFDSYKKFIKKFNSIQNSSYQPYSYTSLSSKTTKSEDNNIYSDFELELTSEQVDTFAKADYLVYRDLKTGYYKPVYRGIDAKLDGNILKASIKDKQLQIVTDGNERYDLLAMEKENTDKYIKYTTSVILEKIPDDISKFKMDNADMTIYYDKENQTANISQITYTNKDNKANSVAANIKDYDFIAFSIASGWKILDDKGNYTGPIVKDGKVVGDGIITGFEEKPSKFRFELAKLDNKYDYYCVFLIKDTHNKTSYSKLVKLK